MRSWVAQTLRRVSTTTTTLHPPHPRWRVGGTSAVWSPAPERKIRGFTASPPGRMCPEWSRWSNRAAGWTTSTVTTGNWLLSDSRRVTGQTPCMTDLRPSTQNRLWHTFWTWWWTLSAQSQIWTCFISFPSSMFSHSVPLPVSAFHYIHKIQHVLCDVRFQNTGVFFLHVSWKLTDTDVFISIHKRSRNKH